MPEEDVTTSGSYNFKPKFFKKTKRVPCPSGAEAESYRNLLDADEFKHWDGLIVLQAKLNNFSHSLHQSVQILRLGVATSQGRHGRDVVVLFVSLDNNREFTLGFHLLILAQQEKSPSRIQSCCDHRRLPNCARLGRARAPVPTRAS